jgi:hypothetical protein
MMSWNLTAGLNPELVRSLRVSLPRRRALFVAGLTVVVLAAGGWLLWAKTDPANEYPYHAPLKTAAELRADHLTGFGHEAFGALTVVLFALFFVFGPAMAGLSFVQERLRGTAIFQQMSLLPPARLAAGKFWGSGVLAYFVAALLVPFALLAAFVGGINPLLVLRLYLFMLIGGLCWQAVGLYISAALSGPAEKPLRGGLLIGPLVAVFAGISALVLQQFFTVNYETLTRAGLAASDEYEHRYWIEQGHYWWRFFGARVPAWLVVLGLTAFAGLWAFAGAVRRVKVWQLIPVSPRAAWVFFAGAEVLLVGLLWGRYPDDAQPIERLQTYLLLNGAALALLAGGSALTRDRLREWWSAERDPLALFRRAEIKGTLQTFLFALCAAEAGLAALWLSYHVDPLGRPGGYQIAAQFLPLAASCAATALGLAAFAQFCAMFRFRVGGWAGVVLAAIFYLFMAADGALFETVNSTPALLNPVVYAEALTKGDYYMDSTYRTTYRPVHVESEAGRVYQGEEPVPPTAYDAAPGPRYALAEARRRGLLAQAGLALLCFALAGWKWRLTRAEMSGLAEPTRA